MLNQRIAAAYGPDPAGFETAFDELAGDLRQAGFEPQVVAASYPEAVGGMAAAYRDQAAEIEQSEAPLLAAARLAGADDFRRVLGDSDVAA